MKMAVLTASTGGGHNVRALALQQWVEKLGLGRAAAWFPLEETHLVYRFGVGLYNAIQRGSPLLHHGYFSFLELASLFRTPSRILGKAAFLARLRAERPDLLVSVHGSTNHGFMDLARQVLGPRVRCLTYCGELGGGYGFSRHWVNPKIDLFLCPVEETARAAVSLGMPPGKVEVVGFLLRPSFYLPRLSEQERTEWRAKLGLAADRFTLLLATGFNGVERHLGFLSALAREGLPVQAIALCGRKQHLKEKLEGWAQNHPTLPVLPVGFTEDMPLFLQLADAVLTRPGAGTCSEAIQCGTPLLLARWGGWMPQELLNVRFCLRRGLGKPVGSPAELVSCVREWLACPESFWDLRRRVREAAPRETPENWLRKVASLA